MGKFLFKSMIWKEIARLSISLFNIETLIDVNLLFWKSSKKFTFKSKHDSFCPFWILIRKKKIKKKKIYEQSFLKVN